MNSEVGTTGSQDGKSMKFIVKCMRRNGVTLYEDDFDATPSYIGHLVIQEVPQYRPGKRPLLQARLLDSPNGKEGRDTVLPVLDPFVKLSSGTMTVLGYQLCIGEDGSVPFAEQCWLLWPATSTN